MRYRFRRFFAMLLALCCFFSLAYAQDDTGTSVTTLDGVNSLFIMDGTLYAGDWDGLYRFEEQSRYPARVAIQGDGFYPNRMTTWKNVIFAIDPQGTLTSFSLAEEGTTIPMPLATLPISDNENDYHHCAGLVADDDAVWVLWAVRKEQSAYAETTLFRVDRSNGELTQVSEENLLNICAYQDGFLLAQQGDREAMDWQGSDENPAALVRIDKTSLKADTLCTLSGGKFFAPAYDGANDFIYIASTNRLVRLNAAFEQETCAHLTLRYVDDRACSLIADGRYLITSSYEPMGFASSVTDPALMPTRTLTLGMSYMDDATAAFCKVHPEIAVALMEDNFYMGSKSVAQSLTLQSSDIDVYSIYLGAGGSLAPLRDKGYYVDFSQSETIVNAMSRMYPQLSAHCYTGDGKPFALPFYVRVSGMGYSPSALEKLGLTVDDLPLTYLELLDFAALWAEEYTDNEWNLTLFEEVYDIRQQLFHLLETAYINQYAVSGEELTFDTPLFRSMLTKLDDITPSIIFLNPELENVSSVVTFEEEAPSLFTTDYVVNPMGWPLSDYEPLPIAVEVSQTPAYAANEWALVANPFGQNLDLALLYVEYMAEHMDQGAALSLCPDENDPIENKWYQEELQNCKASIADLQERLQSANEENRAEIQTNLDNGLLWLEQVEARRWDVSPERIAAYREQAPYMVLNMDDVLSASSIIELESRYLDGALTAEQYVDEVEQRLRLMRLENQ